MPPTIEHNPHERRFTNRIWWLAWSLIAIMWVGFLSTREIDWPSLALGGLTMCILASWAVDITDNKTPSSWRD